MRLLLLSAVFLWPIAAIADSGCDMSSEIRGCHEALEKAALEKYPSIFVKDKDGYSLTINPKHGEPVRFIGNEPVDAASEADIVVYTLLGVLEPSDYAVVSEGFYEGNSMYLVNIDSGSKYKIDGIPILSPDHVRILVSSLDIDANYNKNFLDVYRIDGGKLTREVHVDGEADPNEMWGPDHVVWAGNTLITFDKTTHGEKVDYVYEPQQLKLVRGKWIVEKTRQFDPKTD